ncbi:MAG: hypothetical protein ABI543_03580 [Ignavibacteria bacterium]
MPKSLKILPFLFLLIAQIHAEPKQLNNFIQILDALNSGYKVNAVIHFKDCRVVTDSVESKSQDKIKGIELIPYDYYSAGLIGKKAFISVSQNVMVFLGGGGGYFYNYMKIRIYDDNTVEITNRYLTIDKLEVQMNEMSYGEINDGTNGKAVYFFSN